MLAVECVCVCVGGGGGGRLEGRQRKSFTKIKFEPKLIHLYTQALVIC